MTKVQHNDLLIDWGRYDETARKAMLNEYQDLRVRGNYEGTFFDFLKKKFKNDDLRIKVDSA